MDYGKLAYLKAVDLEERLVKKSTADFGVATTELKNLSSGSNRVISLSGKGDIAVFAKCSVVADFFVDGVKVCSGSDVFFKVVDGGDISVECSQQISTLRVVAIGNVTSSEPVGELYADYNGRTFCYLELENGKATVFTSDASSFNPALVMQEHCVSGDVCAYGSSFLICLLFDDGTLKTISLDGREHLYHIDATKVAVQSDSYSIKIAYIKDGELYYMELRDFASHLPTPIKVSYGGYVDDVRFVRKSTKLLFSSGGKCYVKELDANGMGKDKLYVYLIAEVI